MKKCELGLKCPYQNQRQHSAEYYHGSAQVKPLRPTIGSTTTTKSSGNKLTDSKRTSSIRGVPAKVTASLLRKLDPQSQPRSLLEPSTVKEQVTVVRPKKIRTIDQSDDPIVEEVIDETKSENVRDIQDDLYNESLRLDQKKREDQERLLIEEQDRLELEKAMVMSQQFLAKSLADDRLMKREQFKKTEVSGPPNILIQFRCPDGIVLRRHFAPSEFWADNVFKFINCQEFSVDKHWVIVDPAASAKPVLRSRFSDQSKGKVEDYSMGKLTKLSFIVSIDDEDED